VVTPNIRGSTRTAAVIRRSRHGRRRRLDVHAAIDHAGSASLTDRLGCLGSPGGSTTGWWAPGSIRAAVSENGVTTMAFDWANSDTA
jgi:hypothetical protein